MDTEGKGEIIEHGVRRISAEENRLGNEMREMGGKGKG